MKSRLNKIHHDSAGSILIIVLWVTFGLVTTALYFAHSMSLEMKAADNQEAGMEADQAIEGAALYVSNVLATLQTPNMLPNPANFRAENVKVGDAHFWIIGRDTNDLESSAQGDHPIWGLVDEASKVNLNTATAAMLQNLPNMTANTAAAMFDWGNSNTTPSTDGAKSETYSTLTPPYLCKMAPYETVDELRLVFGLNMDLLYGEDANMNGILDPNENDGMVLPPYDNQDGVLDPGIMEYVTTFTKESTIGSNSIPRVAVNNMTALTALIQSNFPSLSQYLTAFGGVSSGSASNGRGVGGTGTGRGTTGTTTTTTTAVNAPTSVLQFYVQSGMPENDFQQIEPYLMNPSIVGLINVNTATATALSCIPGIGQTLAPQILNYRQGNPPVIPSISWLKSALGGDPTIAAQVGPYVTAYSYQFAADIVAVGHHGRGYRRVKFIFDCSSGTPLIIYRQDLTSLGWALGKKLHDQLLSDNTK
jgi:type II secretory pathway component PulK